MPPRNPEYHKIKILINRYLSNYERNEPTDKILFELENHRLPLVQVVEIFEDYFKTFISRRDTILEEKNIELGEFHKKLTDLGKLVCTLEGNLIDKIKHILEQ